MKPSEQHIHNAIRWYRLNKPTIIAALPIEAPGRTYGRGWPHTLEKYIALHEQGELSEHLARAYIQYPLRSIRKELAAKAKTTSTEAIAA